MTDFLWPLTALCGLGLGTWLYVLTLNRLHPKTEPAPDAAKLFELFEEFKAQQLKEIDNIRGKVEMRTVRTGMRE